MLSLPLWAVLWQAVIWKVHRTRGDLTFQDRSHPQASLDATTLSDYIDVYRPIMLVIRPHCLVQIAKHAGMKYASQTKKNELLIVLSVKITELTEK